MQPTLIMISAHMHTQRHKSQRGPCWEEQFQWKEKGIKESNGALYDQNTSYKHTKSSKNK